MKKLSLILALLLTLTSCLTVCVLPAAASDAFNPPAHDLVMAGGAEIDVAFTENAPVIDGIVNKDEYTQWSNKVLYDYTYIFLGTNLGGLTQDEKVEVLRAYVLDDMAVYANWDGKYFYFAMTAYAPVEEYTCPKAADSVNLFRYWCMQGAAAAPDATGGDRFEFGLGASSDLETPDEYYCYDAWGQRFFNSFRKGVDYCAHWDAAASLVTYEVRLNIKEVIGHAAQEGDQMRFLYLLSQSGQYSQDAADTVQIEGGWGCAMGKQAENYLLLNFVGLPEDVTVDTGEEDGPVEPELEGFWGKTDFRLDGVPEMLTVWNDCDAEPRTDEDGTKYVRLTCRGDDPWIGGPKIPVGLNADAVCYIAVRYRTTAASAKWFGLSYQSQSIKEASDTYLIANDDDLITDGEWHTLVLDCTGASYWNAFITDMLIWPFQETKTLQVGDTMDIQWLRYYTEFPDFGEEPVPGDDTDAPDTSADETSVEPASAEDTAIVTDPSATEAPTAAPEENTTASGEDNGSGCSSFVGLAALLCLIPAAVVIRKKEH